MRSNPCSRGEFRISKEQRSFSYKSKLCYIYLGDLGPLVTYTSQKHDFLITLLVYYVLRVCVFIYTEITTKWRQSSIMKLWWKKCKMLQMERCREKNHVRLGQAISLVGSIKIKFYNLAWVKYQKIFSGEFRLAQNWTIFLLRQVTKLIL